MTGLTQEETYKFYLDTQKRDYKFRVFNRTKKEYEEKSLYNLQEGKIENDENENFVIEKKVGYRDRFGKEIYEGDIIVYYQEITRIARANEVLKGAIKVVPEGKKYATETKPFVLFKNTRYFSNGYGEPDLKINGYDSEGKAQYIVYTNQFRARKALVTKDDFEFKQKGQYKYWIKRDENNNLSRVEIIGNIHKTPELYDAKYKTDFKLEGKSERLEYRGE